MDDVEKLIRTARQLDRAPKTSEPPEHNPEALTPTAAQANPIVNFFAANDSSSRGGIRITLKDLDDDGKADLVLGSGDGRSAEVRVYLGVSASSLINNEAAGALWQNFDPFGFALAGGVYVG